MGLQSHDIANKGGLFQRTSDTTMEMNHVPSNKSRYGIKTFAMGIVHACCANLRAYD